MTEGTKTFSGATIGGLTAFSAIQYFGALLGAILILSILGAAHTGYRLITGHWPA